MKRLGLLAIVSMCVASAAYMGACNGDISLGNPLTPVALEAVDVEVGACGAGSEHPNVCCQAGPGVASCGTYLLTPFALCPGGFSTFPDPRSCCSLTDPTSCSAPPTTTGSSVFSTCVIVCPPGEYEADAGGCCSYDANTGATSCTGAVSTNVPTPICSVPDCAPGGTCPTSCETTGCGSCPSGFSPPNDAGSPLCCGDGGTLGPECFSQAVSAASVAISPPSESEGGVVSVPGQLSDGGSVTSPADAGSSSVTADASTGGTVAVPDAGPG
jgi:hypothetical protein